MHTPAASFHERLVALERAGSAFVVVVLVETLGSTPQDAGAKMLVTADGPAAGTIGGGKVEAKALELAHELLTSPAPVPRLVNWSLKSDVGMSCGGAVKIYFEPHPARGSANPPWPIWIFGAGHVVHALVPVLAPLDCQLTIVDPRRDWIDRVPRATNARFIRHDAPETLIPDLPAHTFVLCLGKGHAADLPILRRALAEREFPYIGVIGSDSKAKILRRELLADGLSPERVARFHCPIGLPFGTNALHEIALSIAAQLLTVRDKLRAG